MKKWIVIGIIVLIIAAAVGYIVFKPTVVQPVPTAKVINGTITEKAQAIGYIKPVHSNKVKSSVDGIVAKIYHTEGTFVTKGTPLIKVEPSPAPSTYANTYENLVTALANERAALKNLQRLQHGIKIGLYSKNYADYITAKQNYQTTKAARILAEQQLALLDKGVTKVGTKQVANVVKSPITGFILSRNVDVGDPVISLSSAQSATTLFTMANMRDLMFEGSVDELDVAKIHLNIPAVVTVGAVPDVKITGKLTQIALQSDQENAAIDATQKVDPNLPFNVSFKVQVTHLTTPKKLTLRSGYSSTADITIATAKNVLILPERVLHFENGKVYVLLPTVDPKQPPKKQYITMGLADGVDVEVKSGLKLGQVVLDQPAVDTTN